MTSVVEDGTSPLTPGTGQADPGTDRIAGSVAAAFLSCGVASAVFGAAVLAAESSETVKAAFTLHEGVGPLSGKTVVGCVAYVLCWLVLHVVLRRRTVRARTALRTTAVLIGVGLLLTFPPVYQIWSTG